MTLKIIHKNNTSAGQAPTPSDLDIGEIAVNSADAELYTKDTNGNIRKFQNATTGTADGMQFTQAGTGAVQRTVESKLQDVVSVKDFGAVGNGTTDDTAAIESVIALGKTIYFPEGTYLLSNATDLVLAANTRIVGDSAGKTILKSTSSTTTSKLIWTTANDTAFENVTLYHAGPAGETAQIVTLKGAKVKILGCEIKSDSSASYNITVQAFSLNHNETVSDILIKNCDIHNVNRVIFKSNTATATLNRFSAINNYVHDLGMGGFQFNFPYGSASDIIISGNHFKDFHDGTERIFCGGASVKKITIADNVFKGSAKECVHIEEEAEDVIITGNIFNISSSAALPMRGVWLSGNDVSGTFASPSNVIINGNTFINAESGNLHTGIEMKVDDNDDIATRCIVSDNVFNGYEYGLEVSGYNPVIKDNFIESCSYGLSIEDGGPNVEGNTFFGCTTGITMVRYEGMVGSNTFINCTTVANTTATDTTKASMTGFKVMIAAGKGGLNIGGVDLPASTTTTVDLPISVGAELWGYAKLNAQFNAPTLFRNRISEVSYDGSTLTDTEKMMNGSGGVTANGFVNNSGKLAFQFNNTEGTARELRRLTVEFDGMWVSSD